MSVVRLQKAKLLCSINSQITNNGISENILDILETIQKLESSKAPNSMKRAYCAVAVDCTVKYLSDYVDAVKRIWWGRLRDKEKSEFASEDLRVWRERIEGVVLGENVCDEILRVGNSKEYALSMVRVYLGEAWAEVGPGLVSGLGEGGLEDMGRGLVVTDGSLGKQSCSSRANDDVRGEGNNAVERELSVPDSSDKLTGAFGTSGEDKDGNLSHITQNTGVRDRPSIRDRGIIRKAKAATKHKHIPSHRRANGQVKFASVQDSDTDILQSEYDTIPTPEVAKLREELKSSCLELQAVVKDPLPDALCEADGLLNNLAKKNTNTECLVEVPIRTDTAHGGVTTAQTNEADIQREAERTAHTREANIQVEMNCCKALLPVPSGNERIDPVFDDGNTTADDSLSRRNDVPRCSLMERNGTAQTFEWEDSIDNSPEGQSKRIKLPAPNGSPISPFKKSGNTRISRRRRKKWSNLEEDTLRMGVQKFGKGNWKVILAAYRDIFEGRNEVDLKDKWRNLTR